MGMKVRLIFLKVGFGGLSVPDALTALRQGPYYSRQGQEKNARE